MEAETPMCNVCFHPHFPDAKCSICGHAGKVNVIPKYLAKMRNLSQLRFYTAKMEEFDTFSANIIYSIGYDVLERECAIAQATFNVFRSDPSTCIYSFSPTALRTYALVGAAAMLSAAHSVVVEDIVPSSSASSAISASSSALSPQLSMELPSSNSMTSVFSASSAGGFASGAGGGMVGGGSMSSTSFVPSSNPASFAPIGGGARSSMGSIGSIPGGGSQRVIVLVQSLAIHQKYRGRRYTIDYLQYVVSDARTQFPEGTPIYLCIYCCKRSPAYASMQARSFREAPPSTSFPPSIVSATGDQFVAMMADVNNLVAWLNL